MADKQKIQYKTYQDFHSGLYNKPPSGDSTTPITAVVECQNVDFTEYGTVKKRKGFTTLSSAMTTSGTIQGLHYYSYQNQLLAVCTDSLYVYDFDDATPAWTSSGSGLVADQKTEFANALTYCWITNNTDTPQRFNGTTMTDSGTGTAPDDNRPLKAEFVIFKHNRLWYGDITESDSGTYTSRYRYSGLRAIEGADAWDIDAWFDVELDDGDNISGLREYKNNTIIVKNNSLHMLKGTSAVDFGQFTYDTKIGCVANRTMREVGDKLLFLNRKGIYSFDGIEIKPFSENIRTTIDTINQSYIHNSTAIYYDNKYLLSIPLASANNSRTLVYNTLSKSWTYYFGITAGDFAIYSPIDGASKLYFSGDTAGISNVSRTVYELFSGDSDIGADIEAYFNTTKFDCGTPFIKKQFHTVWAYAEGNASDSLTIKYRLDYDTAWIPFTSTFDLGNKIQKFSFPAGEKHKGRNIQFQVLNNSSYPAWEFKGFTIEYEEVRRV